MSVTTRNRLMALMAMSLLAACAVSDSESGESLSATTVDVAVFRSRIATDASEVMPLLAGMAAPEFTIHQADGSPYTFAVGPRDKPVIITFYRGGWCPYCSRFLWKMRETEQTLLDMGYELLFISADRTEKLQPFLEQKDISYTLLSDNDLVAARAFGIAFRVSDDYFNMLLEHKIDIEDASGRDHHALPVPAAFIIGTDGIIIRVDADVLVAAARAGLAEAS